jgi:hypothetical protein
MGRRNAQASEPPRWLALALIAGGVMVLGLAAFLAWPRPAGPVAEIEVRGPPKLKVDTERIDLGRVKLGQWVSASFTLTNVGDQPLRFASGPYIEVVEGC